MDQASHVIQTGSPSQDIPMKLRKKSPSDRRRSSRRMEKFLEEKRNNSQPADPSSSDDSKPSAETPMAAVIEESPSVTNTAEDMDTAEINIPVNVTRNNPETQDGSQNGSLPSPVQQQNSPLKEDIRILLCSKNKSTASRLSNHFPKSQFLEAHPTSKKHHFFFKIQVKSSNLPKFKNDIHELNDEMNLIMICVLSEKKNYRPEEQNHCEECDHPYYI